MSTQTEEIETETCEHCRQVFPLDGMTSTSDGGGWWCAGCTAEWRATFDSCSHAFEPYHGEFGPGKYCSKCMGFVEDTDWEHMQSLNVGSGK